MREPYKFIADLDKQMLDLPPDSILSRTFYADEQAKAILFGFAAGQELSEHTASRPAILHFLKGEAHLKLGQDEFEVQEGSWAHMPANLPHSVLAKTPVRMLLYLLENGLE